ncbi:MAG TPA: lysophospholipid acyltransferase family protein [Syntrophobacteria bacterium]|nr:lysophospholipid acyltransferase family protein [Syntrophobacteria bacterium]
MSLSSSIRCAPPAGARRGLLRSFVAGIRPRRLMMLGRIVGQIAYYLDIAERRVVWRNLKFCFPQWSFPEVVRFSKRVYQHLGTVILEMLQTGALRADELIKRVEIVGSEHLLGALEEKRGVVVVSGHTGCWEMAMLAVAARFQVPGTVASKVDRRNRFRDSVRRDFGINTAYKKGAFPGMMQALRQGRIVAMAVDTSFSKNEVEVKFFGKRATMTMSAALLALRCGSPVVPALCHRNPDGTLTLRLSPAFKVERTGDLRADLEAGSQRMTDAVEEAIRQFPEQWLWRQKRWKVFYPELYPEYSMRRKRRKEKRMREKGDAAELSSSS